MSALLPEAPTGEQLVRAIEAAARERGLSFGDFARPISPDPSSWAKQTQTAMRPKPFTIERVRALIEGKRVPPVPAKIFRRGPKVERHRVSAPIEPPIDAVMIVDREPCWRCGVRGDIGCAHRRPA